MEGGGTNLYTLGGDNALTWRAKYFNKFNILVSKVFVIFSQNFFMIRPFSFSVILLLKSMRGFQTNIQALGVRIFETP